MQQNQKLKALDGLLSRLGRGLATRVWMHGAGTVVAVLAAWLLFAFCADLFLNVPKVVRWLHLLVLFALPGWFLWRELLAPMRRLPDRAGLAVLLERAHPESHELLVSAVQLEAEPADSAARPLIDRVLRQAEELAGRIDVSGALDSQKPRRRLLYGTGAAALATVIFLSVPGYSSIFFKRLFGSDVSWPQRTYLTVEIPIQLAEDRLEQTPEEIHVRVARGSDVPVLVRATGEIPDEVTLHFSGGHRVVLGSSGGPAFRTLLPSVQEDAEFYVTGGDDKDGLPRVRLTVLQPPDVAGVALRITPPEYSGLPERVEFDRDVEVLAGSRVEVAMRPDPAEATGRVRILPEDRELELVPVAYPRDPMDDPAVDPGQGLGFEITARETLRYLFELQDASGLPNPDPGLFAIHVTQDREPEVEILAPGRGDVDTVPGGALPLRVRASDDFGVRAMTWTSSATNESSQVLNQGALTYQAVQPETGRPYPDGVTPPPGKVVAVGGRRLDVSELTTDGEQVVEGQQFSIVVSVEDNSAPRPQLGQSVSVRVRVVSPDEFMRRVQDRLARVRITANSLGELQREKLTRTQELIASLGSDQPLDGSEASDLGAAVTGQRRVLGDANSLTRELSSIVEAVLYARVDDRAGPMLEAVDRELAALTEKRYDPRPFQSLVEKSRAGQFGSPELAGKLVGILGHSLDISSTFASEATEALEEAAAARQLPEVQNGLFAAREAQAKSLEAIENLLELLSEWDNFQSILTLTRDILNRQKNLEERTKQFAKDN